MKEKITIQSWVV